MPTVMGALQEGQLVVTLRETFDVSSISLHNASQFFLFGKIYNESQTNSKLSNYSKLAKAQSLDSPAKWLETRYDLTYVSLIASSCKMSLTYFREENVCGYELQPSVPTSTTITTIRDFYGKLGLFSGDVHRNRIPVPSGYYGVDIHLG